MIIELFSINVVSYIYDNIVVKENEVITSLPNVICELTIAIGYYR
ncbi:MAG: hypothetical protein Ct9H90mP18_04580 [Gammaproteobacteria bacterium]|nr:MAG: hypothetical protein Ct9H90mP18_04580 [Gammaproteobacteria bacterium]